MLPRTTSRHWTPGSATVDGNVDSEHPTWLMTARKGKWRLDLASGPLHTRAIAQQLADWLNATNVEQWDRMLDDEIRHVLSGRWG
jgi:hypothetical protein